MSRFDELRVQECERGGQSHGHHVGGMYGVCGNTEIRWIWHQGLSSEATSSIVGSVATLEPSAISRHRAVGCFLHSSTEVA